MKEYSKTLWEDNITLVDASKLNKVEEQLEQSTNATIDNQKKINEIYPNIKKARIATTGEVFDSIGDRIDTEIKRVQNNIKVSMLDQQDNNNHSIDNTIDGKITNTIIKGKTLINLAKQERFVDNTTNVPPSKHKYYSWNSTKNLYSQGKYTIKNTSGYALVWDIRNKIDDKWIRSEMSNKSNIVTLAEHEWIANIQAIESNGVPINSNTQKLLQENCVVLEGDCLNFIDSVSYFEGIKSFGEAEGNKISILSNGKNLFKAYNQKVYGLNFEIINNELTLNGEATQLFDYRVFHKNFNINIYDYINTLPVGTKLTLSNKIGLKNYFSVCKDGKYIYSRDSIVIGDRETDINAFIRVDPNRAFNKDEIKIQLEIGNLTSYEPYKEDKKDILIKEPLREGNVMYENNGRVEVCRKVKQYTFTGNEIITKWADSPDACWFTLRDSFKMNYSVNSSETDLLCDNFKTHNHGEFTTQASINNNVTGITAFEDYFTIRIEKSKLSTPDVNGFKAWLKANPTTIVYQLATPVTEVIENVDNLNLKTYDTRTYISFENNIQGTSSFKAPINTIQSLKTLDDKEEMKTLLTSILNSLNKQ